MLGVLGFAPSVAAAAQPCSGDPGVVHDLSLTVGGQPTTGLYVLPAGPPRGLVVFGHGYSHGADSWREHMTKVVARDGVIAVAMDYRGIVFQPRDAGGVLRTRGWPVRAGGEDLVAAGQYFDAACPGLAQVILYGVSMGANATGMAMTAQAKRADGKRPLFDYWFAVEGVHNMPEIYQGARALSVSGNEFANNAYQDIEVETGGTMEAKPAEYSARVECCARRGHCSCGAARGRARARTRRRVGSLQPGDRDAIGAARSRDPGRPLHGGSPRLQRGRHDADRIRG